MAIETLPVHRYAVMIEGTTPGTNDLEVKNMTSIVPGSADHHPTPIFYVEDGGHGRGRKTGEINTLGGDCSGPQRGRNRVGVGA